LDLINTLNHSIAVLFTPGSCALTVEELYKWIPHFLF